MMTNAICLGTTAGGVIQLLKHATLTATRWPVVGGLSGSTLVVSVLRRSRSALPQTTPTSSTPPPGCSTRSRCTRRGRGPLADEERRRRRGEEEEKKRRRRGGEEEKS